MHKSPLLLLVLAVALAQSGYHQIKRSAFRRRVLDYLITDPATDRIFVSHGTQVDVVDGKKGEVMAPSRA